MNTYKDNKITYKLESFWSPSKKKKIVDSVGKEFDFPKANKHKWGGQDQFVGKLKMVEAKAKVIDLKEEERDCLLCDKKKN